MSVASALFAAVVASGSAQDAIVVLRPDTPPATAAWRASLHEGRPALRGFRAPSPANAEDLPPIDLPSDESMRRASRLVAQRLAHDGLLSTTAAAIASLGATEPELSGGTDRLRAIGLPVDWLEFLSLPDEQGTGGAALVRKLTAALAAGAAADSLRESFTFRPSVPGFSVATESGEDSIGLVRLQIASPEYWKGPGDGGSLDIVRQLLDALPEADFVASVEEKHVTKVLEAARGWNSGRRGRCTLVPEPLPVSQWAQDDGKPGFAGSAGADRVVVTLVPRYASRGEDGALFVPGETFVADGLAAAGQRVARSPLLFQGGDLLAVRDPKSGERLLFIGEANLWRNTALGLSREQALEAFRIEFGVDRCQVLPAISFHIDQEVSVRAKGDRLIVFVADPVEAVHIVLRCGVGALEATGVLKSSEAAQALADLDAGKDQEFLSMIVPATGTRCTGFGRFPESFAQTFARGTTDSGVGNLQRFLLAMDLLMSWALPVDELPLDPHSIAYLRSFQRRDAERREMIADLRRRGFDVVKIPSLPEANRGIDYLNGVHSAGKYLMPTWGGLYAPLDQAALAAFRRSLGADVEVVSIFTSESQRRGGALHCSMSVCPRP